MHAVLKSELLVFATRKYEVKAEVSSLWILINQLDHLRRRQKLI